MPASRDESVRLRNVHDDYIWEVNAAVAEGRDDLVGRLVDDYLAAATDVMAGGRRGSCEPGCPACNRPRGHRSAASPRRWRRPFRAS